ncbi:diguanylate cyclase [Moraxellaceae bacterium AER2_44_116]|nr:diguanylate cyclase [Moraxellaceae bacterium]TQC98502.1 diguanylate cyclase [Moraxellaceae bacterium AER2_44_116]
MLWGFILIELSSPAIRATILVVDDNLSNIEVIYEMLTPTYEVLFATSGLEALELTVATHPDLILLDVMMPGLNGYEVCRHLKADIVTQHIPIIFITAVGQTDSEEKGLKLGAIDYIAKPFSPAVVKARIANHLELKRYRDLLADLAWVDGLTGVRNRRQFDDFIERELRTAVRADRPLSLIMLDIDYFKHYNDHYGHLMGDDCLKKVAQTLESSLCRSADMIFRYGGEEFACLLPETNAAGAMAVANRMLDVIQTLNIEHVNSAKKIVTLSIGVCTLIPQQRSKIENLIVPADKALYRAKELGRNRVEFADE